MLGGWKKCQNLWQKKQHKNAHSGLYSTRVFKSVWAFDFISVFPPKTFPFAHFHYNQCTLENAELCVYEHLCVSSVFFSAPLKNLIQMGFLFCLKKFLCKYACKLPNMHGLIDQHRAGWKKKNRPKACISSIFYAHCAWTLKL